MRRIIYTKIEDLDVLITASADRTIKLWEPKNQKTNNPFQTIIGHTGTILDMVYIQKVQLLVTSGTDKTMRIWKLDEARQLLMYPWFIQHQMVDELDVVQDSHIWINCFDFIAGQ